MEKQKQEILTKERSEDIEKFISRIGLNIKEANSLTKNKLNMILINEALTHKSANYFYNYEILEFLGDAVLRLASSEYIEENFSQLNVGDRSALRSQIVSDEWLASVGSQIGIKKVITIGPKVINDQTAVKTIEADGLEALIGAIYKCLNDIKVIKKWLNKYWDITSKEFVSDPDKFNSKSALQEWSQSKGKEKPYYYIKEVSQKHGDPKRFYCEVSIDKKVLGKGWGKSRRNAEKEAAKVALQKTKCC